MKLVHLVGFITPTKKFVTMHGHMNVKDYQFSKSAVGFSPVCL